jgi:mycothiol synthase
MTAMQDSPGDASSGGERPSSVRRVTSGELIAAAGRLTGGMSSTPTRAGRAFVERARAHGVDLRYFWASFTPAGAATQAALIVPQVGRTAMIFLSGPGPSRACGDASRQLSDRVSVLRAAMSGADGALGDALQLFQALPAPEEIWGIEAFGGAGMTRLGDLAYLRRPFTLPGDGVDEAWPAGVAVRRVGRLDGGGGGELAALRRALERTYEGTLDCPGLCALRTVDDVIESHKSAGNFERAHWWLIEADGDAEGCVLLSPSFETRSLELVYMGLGPRLRGRGLAASVLRFAIRRAQRLGLDEISCAVDLINEPARSLYARLGFTEFARRIAFVRPSSTNPGR